MKRYVKVKLLLFNMFCYIFLQSFFCWITLYIFVVLEQRASIAIIFKHFWHTNISMWKLMSMIWYLHALLKHTVPIRGVHVSAWNNTYRKIWISYGVYTRYACTKYQGVYSKRYPNQKCLIVFNLPTYWVPQK